MLAFIVPIVEGESEVLALPSLLVRIWEEYLQQPKGTLVVLSPLHPTRGQFLHDPGTLPRMIEAAWIRVRDSVNSCPPATGMALIVMDLDEEPSTVALRQRLLDDAMRARSDARIACVIANPMFENWIIAGATPLAGKHGLPTDLKLPADREACGGKHFLDQLLRSVKRNVKYRETTHAKLFVSVIDIAEAYAHSPSFASLCNELQKLSEEFVGMRTSAAPPDDPPASEPPAV